MTVRQALRHRHVTWDDQSVLDHEHDGVWVGVLPVADVPGYRLGWPTTLAVADDPYRSCPPSARSTST